jgi:wobble nucleotide-excising tRNase
VVTEDTFKDACWKQKQEFEDRFRVAFAGFLRSALFKDKVLSEKQSNKAEVRPLDYILTRAELVFRDDVEQVALIPTISTGAFIDCESASILGKRVIGKSDVDIAAMIERLGNSDWVRSGRSFLPAADEKCPFCQEKLPPNFAAKLDAYFDETFEADSKAIHSVVSQYEAQAEAICRTLELILTDPASQLNSSTLTLKKKLLEAQIEINRQRLGEKRKEPSRSVELLSSKALTEEIDQLICDANEAIRSHNSTVANLATERATLKSEVWKFLVEGPLKAEIAEYEKKKSAIESAVTNLRRLIQEKEQSKREKEEELRQFERQITSTQPTVDAINGLLKSFGFGGFSVAQAGEKACYKLIRPNGEDAKQTLSEGEATFITFLYFYHLIHGSIAESGIKNDRVVVFDDPVSSLDSDVLFIVSTLIRRLCDDVREGRTVVKQIFLLTHNVYFHKEVTFQKSRGTGLLKDEAFWTIRKSGGESQAIKHSSNPIKSSYELLWMEVREAKPGNLSVQNALRRILETYFKLLGGVDLDKIQDRFEGPDKLACRSLLSWVNDGSHFAHDDLFVAVDESTVELYLNVFKRIFEVEGYVEHYNMMMMAAHAATVSQ